ncbi:MAG: class I SAM-dependent methyltransferase [Sphingomonadales bacterium]|nr:class I SAM-dependent methyltransferase [Sphingomonadales bacterium]
MTTSDQWQADVGKAWAAEAARTDRSFAALTPGLLDAIAARPGKAVLDIGCGAGELSLAVARARPQAQVLGVDISAELVAVARERAAGLANARFLVADAAAADPGFQPDLLVSRQGVMFFDDPVAAFARLCSHAAPGAALVFSCFRAETENPWAWDLARMVAWPDQPQTGGTAPGPFAFADPARVERLLTEAGWRDVELAPADYSYLVGEGDDAVADALSFLTRIGPAARALRDRDEADRARIVARMEAWLSGNCRHGRIVFPAAAWIVTARQ